MGMTLSMVMPIIIEAQGHHSYCVSMFILFLFHMEDVDVAIDFAASHLYCFSALQELGQTL